MANKSKGSGQGCGRDLELPAGVCSQASKREIFALVLQNQQQCRERVLGIKSELGAMQLAPRDGEPGGDLYGTKMTPQDEQDARDLGLGEQGVLQIMSGNHLRAAPWLL